MNLCLHIPRFLAMPVLIALLALALACGGGGSAQPTPTSTALPATSTQPPPAATATPEAAAETLAFVRDGDIWLIDAGGGNERQLGLAGVLSFSWVSPDELDVVALDDRPKHLLVDVDGGVQELLFPGDFDLPNVHVRGSWSADGRLFVVPIDEQLVFYDRNGDEVRRLDVEPPRGEDEPVSPCNPPPTPKTEDRGLVFGSPVFSRDGRSVIVGVYCSLTGDVNPPFGLRVVLPQNTGASLYDVPLDGGSVAELSVQTNLRLGAPPRLSPDGGRIAQINGGYGSLCNFPRGLSVADADGANGRDVTPSAVAEILQQNPHESAIGGPIGFDWSPSSDALVVSYDMRLVGKACSPGLSFGGLYIVPLDGSPEEQLADAPTQSPAWSPSGRYIAYVAGEFFGDVTEPPAIRILDLNTREVIDAAIGSQLAWRPQP